MSILDELTSPRRAVDVDAVQDLYRKLLEALGEDPDRDGLRATPARVAAWWQEFLDYQPGACGTTFTHPESTTTDSFVAVNGITAWTLCEHHLLPFRLSVSCGYSPSGRVVGRSKIVRIVQAAAHRLQIQERLTVQVAEAIAEVTGSPNFGVWATGEHLCMSICGTHAEAARTVTECLRGRLRTDTALTARMLTSTRLDKP